MDREAGSGNEPVERGAAEEAAGAPLTPTEIDASRRPPSAPDDSGETADDPGESAVGYDESGIGGGLA